MIFKDSPISLGSIARKSALLDLIAFIVIFTIIVLISVASKQFSTHIIAYKQSTISLDIIHLPYYALLTTLRLFIGIIVSLIFTIIVATLAAKSSRAEMVLLPSLDILQSVPVLGYISFTVTGFVSLFPEKALGVEMAAIFAIFTAQVWNMTFSLYQSLCTIPQDLHDSSAIFGLTPWQKFWKVELPFAVPGLIQNTMVSMSGSWFFVVASEAVSVGHIKFLLPGIGSYISVAIEQENLSAVGYAIISMFAVILLYDQLLFRPIVAWADKFKYELESSTAMRRSWLIDMLKGSRIIKAIGSLLALPINILRNIHLPIHLPIKQFQPTRPTTHQLGDFIWYLIIALCTLYGATKLAQFFGQYTTLAELRHVFFLGFITTIRIFVLILVAVVIWVPIGVYIGLRPRLAEKCQPIIQILAAFPANLFFPIAVILILQYKLNPEIWLSPLIILGTQWYILFNVIAGASSIPNDLIEASSIFQLKGWIWWRKVIIPGIYPYLITGMITASGGAWNASIISEAANWGSIDLYATGLGAYISQKTVDGDFPHIALGVCVMCTYVFIFNKILWQPLYDKAKKQIHLD